MAPQALRTLLEECGFAWCEDASNQNRCFKRNRLRLDVLPLLREENPSLDRTLHDLWRMARLDEEYWHATLQAALRAHPWVENTAAQSLTLPQPLLAALPPAARLRLYLLAVRRLCGDGGGNAAGEDNTPRAAVHGQARARTLLALDEALRAGRGNTRFQLPGGLEAYLKGGCVVFGPKGLR